jgi:hypothetical protein
MSDFSPDHPIIRHLKDEIRRLDAIILREEIDQLREATRKKLSKIDLTGYEEPAETLAAEKKNAAARFQRFTYENFDKLVDTLDKSLDPEALRHAYGELLSLITMFQELTRSTMTPFGAKLEAREKMAVLTNKKTVAKAQCDRREEMKPVVVTFAGTLTPEILNSVKQFNKFLKTNPDFRKSLPKNPTKDVRTLMSDIKAILFSDRDDADNLLRGKMLRAHARFRDLMRED